MAADPPIPLRPRGYTPDPLGPIRAHLDPSPDIEAAFAGQDAVERIRRVVDLPGHRSLRAAATAMGLCYATFHHQLPIVEQALGFKIIERSLPLRLTPKGEVFIAEARAVLRLLDDTAPNGQDRSGLFKFEPQQRVQQAGSAGCDAP
jgi:hypothetical protein